MSGNMQHANYYHHPLGVLSLCMAAVIVLVVDVSVAQVSIPRLLASTVAPSVSCTPNFYGTGTCTSHNNREECDYDGGDCCESTCGDGYPNAVCPSSFNCDDCLEPGALPTPCSTNDDYTGTSGEILTAIPTSSPTGSQTREPTVTRARPSTPPPVSNTGCPLPSGYGDGFCQATNNVVACDYDGGDCCACTCVDSTTSTCGRDSQYDCKDPSCSDANSTDVAAIVGGVVGGIAVIGILIAGLFYWKHKQHQSGRRKPPPHNDSNDGTEDRAAPSDSTGISRPTGLVGYPAAAGGVQYPARV